MFSTPGTVTQEDVAQVMLKEEEKEIKKALAELEAEKRDLKSLEKLVGPVNVDGDSKVDEDAQFKPQNPLYTYVNDRFDASEKARVNVEQDWINALKQYKGIYSAEVVNRIVPSRSSAYVRITRTKVKTVDSRLSDLLFPANGDKNWEIYNTPLPELSENKRKAIAQMYEEETKQPVTPEQLTVLIQKEAANQARKMSAAIADQLAELRYREIMRDVIHSGNMYGTGILKGPLVAITENKQYYKQNDENGGEKWALKDYDKIIPFAENVRIWDIYPDMEATNFDDCRYIVQRRKMNKHDVLKLAKRKDFSGKAIKKYVSLYPYGNYTKKPFEVELQNVGDVTTPNDQELSHSNKYEVLEFWGYVDSELLSQAGVTIPEDKKGLIDIPANVWVLGDTVIKAALTPIDGVRWPFFAYYYDKDETCIFGEGIPSIMSTMQEMTNSAFRAMLDNAAISAGPQIEVNLDLLATDEDPREIHPFKVWLRTGTGSDASYPCIRSFELPSYTTEFQRMLEVFRDYGDEITTIPRYMWGDTAGGAGRTSSGLSMLMGSANMAIKDQVKNFDDGITAPFIRAMYHWNMQFNADDDIKGDYAVVARGSASLIAKEMRTQYLIDFLQITQNEADANIIKRPEIIRNIADAFDIDSNSIVMTEAEIQAQQKEAEARRMQEQEFMTNIIEAAREYGVSPESLVSNMRQVQQQQQQQAAQMAQQQQQPMPGM